MILPAEIALLLHSINVFKEKNLPFNELLIVLTILCLNMSKFESNRAVFE